MINNDIEDFLSKVDTLDLIKRIEKFKSLSFNCLTKKEIFNQLNNVLMPPGANSFYFIPNCGAYPANTIFYRVRHLDGNPIDNKDLIKYSDLWEPPTNCVKKMGRLNEVGESLLYTSPLDAYVAINESHIKDGEIYALISYRSVDQVKVNIIGGEYDYKNLGFTNKNALINNELYNGFLKDIFSRDVGEGTEYLYILSNVIAKSYFDLPPESIQDAWAYNSVQDKSKYNVCFRPKIAHKLLKIESTSIHKRINDKLSQFIGNVEIKPDNQIVFLPALSQLSSQQKEIIKNALGLNPESELLKINL